MKTVLKPNQKKAVALCISKDFVSTFCILLPFTAVVMTAVNVRTSGIGVTRYLLF